MHGFLHVPILAQPDETTCGPTCLEAVYAYYGKPTDLMELVRAVDTLDGGGTLGVHLGRHALANGFRATVYSYNLRVFDPSWNGLEPAALEAKLRARAAARPNAKLKAACAAYCDFLQLGGVLRFEDLTVDLLSRYLAKGTPILTGLSATYLYGSPREIAETNIEDDVLGDPAGHFVVLCGIDRTQGLVAVSDPLDPNPRSTDRTYLVPSARLIGSIFLGVLTYDANLLVIEPAAG